MISGSPLFSENIYAAGDVASYNSEWFGQWTVAALQGQIAGANAAGGDEHYRMDNSPYLLSTMGTRMVVSGKVSDAPETGHSQVRELNEGAAMEFVQHTDADTYSYIKLAFKNKILTGGILIGDYFSKYSSLQMMLKNKATKETVLVSDLFPR
jgi:NAD(P)H-nitrite reductase large subunit